MTGVSSRRSAWRPVRVALRARGRRPSWPALRAFAALAAVRRRSERSRSFGAGGGGWLGRASDVNIE